MIELGKYGSTFYVTGRDNIDAVYYNNTGWKIVEQDQVFYKGIECIVKSVNNDTYGLQLISNNQEDSIPIVI